MGDFGWDLPPGVTQREIDRYYGDDDEGPDEDDAANDADARNDEAKLGLD